MGCFLRHDFEKELKSKSHQHESQSQNLRPRICHCRRSEMRQSAGRSCLPSATNPAEGAGVTRPPAVTNRPISSLGHVPTPGAELEIQQVSGGCSPCSPYDFCASPRRKRRRAGVRRRIPNHWNIAGPWALSASGTPAPLRQEKDAHPCNRGRHTDGGLRIGHGSVVLELDPCAGGSGAVLSRGEL